MPAKSGTPDVARGQDLVLMKHYNELVVAQ